MSLVKTSFGSLNEVVIIQRNGKIVRAQRMTTQRWSANLTQGIRIDCDWRDRDARLAIVDLPFDEAELEPGQKGSYDEDEDRDRTG